MDSSKGKFQICPYIKKALSVDKNASALSKAVSSASWAHVSDERALASLLSLIVTTTYPALWLPFRTKLLPPTNKSQSPVSVGVPFNSTRLEYTSALVFKQS